jgi:hypothetical protein
MYADEHEGGNRGCVASGWLGRVAGPKYLCHLLRGGVLSETIDYGDGARCSGSIGGEGRICGDEGGVEDGSADD